LVVAKFRGRLAMSNLMFKKMDVERFNLKQLKEEEVKISIRLQSKITFQLWRT
jgi:hypothetical protein